MAEIESDRTEAITFRTGDITYLTGHMKLDPVRYWISEQVHHRKWWFDRTDYFVEGDFMKFGPLESRDAAQKIMSLLNGDRVSMAY